MIDLLRRLRGEIAIANKAAAAERERIARLADTWGHSTFAQFLRGDNRHCAYPHCVGGQAGTHCYPSCACTDCHGLGYDSSGQRCACQFKDD